MKKLILLFFAMIFMAVGAGTAFAAKIELCDWAFDIGGDYAVWPEEDIPWLYTADTDFDWVTGLGTLSVKFDPGVAGTYYVYGYFDYDMYDDNGDGVFDDETATVMGTADATYDQWGAGYNEYDYTDPDGDTTVEGDVRMAIGYDNIVLEEGEHVHISFIIGVDDPGVFCIFQSEDDSTNYDGQLYLSSSIRIDYIDQAIPEPTTILLLGIGLLGVSGLGRRKN